LFGLLDRPFVVLRGTYEERYEQARKEIDSLLELER
jgi:hypothetical protein